MGKKFEYGEHVKANFGSGVELGHVVKGAHDVGGEEKYGVLGPDGTVHTLAYTAESVADAGGYFTDAS